MAYRGRFLHLIEFWGGAILLGLAAFSSLMALFSSLLILLALLLLFLLGTYQGFFSIINLFFFPRQSWRWVYLGLCLLVLFGFVVVLELGGLGVYVVFFVSCYTLSAFYLYKTRELLQGGGISTAPTLSSNFQRYLDEDI